MLATSWNAKGLVKPIWHRLEGTYRREQLAELTGIPANNLSRLNSGALPMTMRTAQKIADAVEGVTVLDLGAPGAGGDVESELALDRLARLEERLERLLQHLVAEGIVTPGSTADGRSSPNGSGSQTGTDG